MSKNNVIYLIADSLRADHLGCYGDEDVLTTQIDSLAADGVLFENVVSAAPWTVPSVATHTTGKYPHRLGVFNPEEELGERTETVFERFKGHGYTTAAHFDSERRRDQFRDHVDHHGWSYDIEDVLEFISANSDENFFMMNLYRGTHFPYVLKYSREAWYDSKDELMDRLREGTPEAVQEIKYRYRRSIEQFSEWYLSAIVDRLKREGILEDTVIVVTADHGESWERRYDDLSELELFDLHGPLLYDEVLKVPLVVYNLGSERGLRVEEMTRSVDILPTLLTRLGLPPDTDGDSLDGVSLAPVFEGDSDAVTFPETAYASTTEYESPSDADLSTVGRFAIVRDGWKLIWTPSTGTTELYDLSTDPTESHDLVDEHVDRAAELRDQLEQEVAASETGSAYSADEEASVEERLEDLGYL